MAASREKLMAFVDGELSPEEERRIAAEIAANPALAAYVEEQRALKARLAMDFSPVVSTPVPARFEQMILAAPRQTSGPSANLFRRIFSFARPVRLGGPLAAAAAGIAIGIGITNWFSGGAIMENANGALVARGELAAALSTQLAADQPRERSLRIAVSFVNRDGNFCRSFQTSDASNAMAGIACREQDEWRIVATAATQPLGLGQFRQAAAGIPENLRQAISNMISGQPLNAAAERAARARNWTNQ